MTKGKQCVSSSALRAILATRYARYARHFCLCLGRYAAKELTCGRHARKNAFIADAELSDASLGIWANSLVVSLLKY